MNLDLSGLRAEPSGTPESMVSDTEASVSDTIETSDVDDLDDDEFEPTDPTSELSRNLSLDAPFVAPESAPIVGLPVRGATEPSAPAPAAAAAAGEFDRVPAPPLTTEGLARRPVTPADAMPPATVKLPEAPAAGLPTRTPGRGPDGGPDRLAPPTGPAVLADALPVAPTSSPSALQAALTAFDSRRNGNDALPTRDRNAGGVPSSFDFEEPASTTQSRLDPEVLRERLRAFQNEFRTASAGATDKPDHSSNLDLGGDRR
jgi:hypothetical protein